MSAEQGTSVPGLTWFKSTYSSSQGDNCVEVAVDWFKSSYSGDHGGDCVEVALGWHKSSHSSGEGGACVEVAACPSLVHVRDSKDVDGPQLAVGPEAWAAFVGRAAREALA
ncbi:DUF397 domain-containing protein [Streptomyces nanshensis]|uniref:Toxin-antitoxin system toxin subunit n=1 Tax=Streptomyces nanshensis TaxID=518642 RepID=A0A1E7L5X7_9ACTN|nr:DUF397 domain-containing protein [Streptomyces nanshensis]OEV11606.1 toxin-antitoxin system toxin subunit [Streptomyces nanshensis]